MIGMDEATRRKMGENALAYAKEHFNKDRQMDRLDEVFAGAGNGEEIN